jgi:hypothetical protein
LFALVGAGLGFGALVLAVTIVAGRRVLSVIYGPEYAAHTSVLLWLMAAAVITFASVFLGTGTIARGRFGAQLAISATALAVVAASMGPLVQRYGLNGAACSLLLGSISSLACCVLTFVISAGAAGAQLRPCRGRTAVRERTRALQFRISRTPQARRRRNACRGTCQYFLPTGAVGFRGADRPDGALDRVRDAGGEVIKCRLGARFGPAFYQLLRKRRYDVVHSHVHYSSGVMLAIARAAGVPVRVAHLHTAVVNGRPNTIRRRAQLAICRALLQQYATAIVACGEGTMPVASAVDRRSAVRVISRQFAGRALDAARPDADAHRRQRRPCSRRNQAVDRRDAPARQRVCSSAWSDVKSATTGRKYGAPLRTPG